MRWPGVRSGALTAGTGGWGRRRSPSPRRITSERLRDHYVILSAEERRNKILRELAGVRFKPDRALLDTLVYLTEYPTADYRAASTRSFWSCRKRCWSR